MENYNLIFSEIFISISIMLLLIIGVYKNNSSNTVYNISIITLIIILVMNINLFNLPSTNLFSGSYTIDYFSNFMKLLTILSGIFVMLTSSTYLQINKISVAI